MTIAYDNAVVVGTWHEPTPREITHCPSYYAADTETLAVKPDDYEARLIFQGGFTIPMPDVLLIRVDTKRVAGRLYSGFGGVNFSSQELPVGVSVFHTIQVHCSNVAKLVADGTLSLKPEFEWLVAEGKTACWENDGAPKTWADVEAFMKPTTDPRGVLRKIIHVSDQPDATVVKFECGHTNFWAPHIHATPGEVSHCFKCRGVENSPN